MQTYYENIDGTSITQGDETIPKTNPRYGQVLSLVDAGEAEILPFSPSSEEKVKSMDDIVEAELSSVAGEYGYRDIDRAISYRDSTRHPEKMATSQSFYDWRDDVWDVAEGMLIEWQAGGPEPTPQEVLDALPTFVVPYIPVT